MGTVAISLAQKPRLVWFVTLLLGTPGLKSRCHRDRSLESECKYYELFISSYRHRRSQPGTIVPSSPQETPKRSEPRG